METRRLQYFLQIVDAGSISRAAATIGMAQPALSQQLAILETELKVRLFDRSATGVTPTQAGQRLYVRAQGVLRQLDSLKLEVAEISGAVAGLVAVGVPPTHGDFIGGHLLARVREEHPGIRLRLIEDGSSALVAGLQGGGLDMAVCPVKAADTTLSDVLLFKEELFLLSAPDRRPTAAQLGDLADLPWIVTSSPNSIRGQLGLLMSRAQRELNIIAEVNSLPLVIAAVRAGLGVTLLPLAPVADALSSGAVVATPLPEPRPFRTVHLHERRDHTPTPAAQVVRGMILDRASTVGASVDM
jgi:LysR family nitrogen assimilation transcriptional regulator